MSSLASRLVQLEKQKKSSAEGIDEIRVYFMDEDGSAFYVDEHRNRINYTAAEFAALQLQDDSSTVIQFVYFETPLTGENKQ